MSTETPSPPPVRVVLCWHMHQPSYLNPSTNDYQLPWTYLHVIKDYVDMVAHLEAAPKASAVVNFSPTLIEQIDDYAAQVAGFLDTGQPLRDPILRALAEPALPGEAEERHQLVRQCLRLNHQRLIEAFPALSHLIELGRWAEEHASGIAYLNDQFLVDLITWYHLAWTGETVRRSDERIRRLIAKGSGFTVADRRLLLTVIGELLEGVLGRYRRLAEAGRIELAMTPYAHPILPLLQELDCAREAWPQIEMPLLERYPGGEARARWHIEHGLQVFTSAFGCRPGGCWPAEGGVSQASLTLLNEFGFHWAASGGAVLDHTLDAAEQPAGPGEWHRAYQPAELSGERPLRCFFRDDGLSDAIGFTYSGWHGDDAVANLVERLEQIAAHAVEPEHTVISIIMDGENAWEHYPLNGYYFLNGLYHRLSEHPQLTLTTFSAAAAEVAPRPLPQLVAGSWVYGTFSTWIGEVDKNHAWDLLGEAKRAFDRVAPQLDAPRRARAEQQLAICESSDWFWWFGDYNPPAVIGEIDYLYRLQLTALYERLALPPPEHLSHPFARLAEGSPEGGGAMRHAREGG